MEQQAKERLTGGVILVVLLVLLVPELLTGPRPAPPPTPAQPDQAPLRSYTMDLGESPHARAPVAASTATTGPSVATAPAPTPGPAVASSAPQPAPLPPPASAPAVSAPPSPPPPASPPPAPPPVAAHTGAWTVQLGIFSNRENATRLVATLRSHGFNPSLTDATKSGHKLFRVRVGNEHDRAAAQKLLARLKAAGVKGGEVVAR